MEYAPFYESLENGPLAIAHRGGNAANTHDLDGNLLDKQNSIAAFESAWRAGIEYGETDAVATQDGVVLAFHGSKNSRQENKTGLPTRQEIQSMPFRDIQEKVRIGGEPMPSMDELLTTFPEMKFFIDPKTEEVVRPLAQLIDKLHAHERVSIGAFSYKRSRGVVESLNANKSVATTVGPMGTLAILGATAKMPGMKNYLKRSGITGFAIPHAMAKTSLVEIAHEMNMPVSVWTPNTEGLIYTALQNGVDGVMSDETNILLDTIASVNNQWSH